MTEPIDITTRILRKAGIERTPEEERLLFWRRFIRRALLVPFGAIVGCYAFTLGAMALSSMEFARQLLAAGFDLGLALRLFIVVTADHMTVAAMAVLGLIVGAAIGLFVDPD